MESSSAEELKGKSENPLLVFPSFRGDILNFWFNMWTTFVLNICGVTSLSHSSLKALKELRHPNLTVFLLHVLICLPVLLHKYEVIATWKYIYKLTKCKIMVSLLGDRPFNYALPPPRLFIFLFGWVEKVLLCSTVPDTLWAIWANTK